MSTQIQINATAASLLGFLQSGPMTGWALAAAIDESIGNFWNVTRSQVYRELANLADLGLVEAEAEGTRERRPYRITEKGEEAFRNWLRQEPGPELIRSPLLLSVFFGAYLDPDRLRRFLAAHRVEHERRLEAYRELEQRSEAEMTSFMGDTLRFGLAYEELFLRWITSVEARITGARAPGSRSGGTG